MTDFEGVGADDTAIREQLIDAVFKSDGRPTVDHFVRGRVEESREQAASVEALG